MSRRLSLTIFIVDIVIMLVFIFSRWHMTITLNAEAPAVVAYGQTYVAPGATAHFEGKDIDIFDKDFPVTAENTVDTSVLGEQTLRYHAGRLFYSADEEITVTVVDDSPPVLQLGDVPLSIDAGQPWQDSFTAYDERDGDLTSQVTVSGYVDTNTGGNYTLTYTVMDSLGNTATAERTVHVEGVAQPVTGPKIVFLTFDDGPCDNTDELLDTLARHNAKATFFVTGNSPSNNHCIARAAQEGHTVAVHTYTHNFDAVYASSDAYWADFEKTNDLIEEMTGYRSKIFRFPGGSSNTISSFNPGIMTRLTQEAQAKGLDWFDWNVDCGDGGGLNDPEQVFQNIISGMQVYDVAVVLCHDTHHTTVQAIENVLTWGEENGYTFLPLQKGITTCHHGVNN